MFLFLFFPAPFFRFMGSLGQSPVQQVISPAPVWFPVTPVPEITTSLNMAALTASPVPSMGPPQSQGPPPYSTVPVSVHDC